MHKDGDAEHDQADASDIRDRASVLPVLFDQEKSAPREEGGAGTQIEFGMTR